MRTASTLAVLGTVLLAEALYPADISKAGMDPQRLARIPARMKAFVNTGTIAGSVTLVARQGVVASLEAAGYQDLETKKPMRSDTIFQVMSMTKPVVAVAIMILVEEGRLALADPVEKYLPEFRDIQVMDHGLRAPLHPPAIHQLLTHTAGMSEHDPEALGGDRAKLRLTLSEVVKIISAQPLDYEPGTKHQYSGIGIATAGRIAESVSGQPLERFLDERIFRPLGMKDTFFFPPADKQDRIAMVYQFENGRLKRSDVDLYRKDARYANPAGGLFSTASDLAAFHQMMLNGGSLNGARVLSKASTEMMTQLHTGDLPIGATNATGYGLGWTVVRSPLGTLSLQSIGTYAHSGSFGTYGWVDPPKDLIGIYMSQRIGGGHEERNAFLAMAAAAIR